jgi:hypothetical protein
MRATTRRITDPRPPTSRSGTNPPDRVTAMGAERSVFRVHPRRQRRGSGHQWAGRSRVTPVGKPILSRLCDGRRGVGGLWATEPRPEGSGTRDTKTRADEHGKARHGGDRAGDGGRRPRRATTEGTGSDLGHVRDPWDTNQVSPEHGQSPIGYRATRTGAFSYGSGHPRHLFRSRASFPPAPNAAQSPRSTSAARGAVAWPVSPRAG